MAGIYIHIPFCKQRCIYCDFHFSTSFNSYRAEMIEAICVEIIERKKYLDNQEIKTIYFGGGTPSLLLDYELKSILDTIHSNFVVKKSLEITLEVNPDDIKQENLIIWRKNGVNRLSIGIQSLKQSDLDWMNRSHKVEDSFASILLAQKYGFDNINVDLIYGLPNLSMEDWVSHLNFIIQNDLITHLSAYCLTVENNTILNDRVIKRKINLPNEDVQSDQFLKLIEMIEKSDFEQYEISNFSRSGFESKHNSNYWKGFSYLGVGPSAHSFNGESRSWNLSNNKIYIKKIKENNLGYNETEKLSKLDQFNERILIGLRTIYGVNLNELSKLNKLTKEFQLALSEFKDKKWIEEDVGVLTLTKEGKLRADYIASGLFIS
ncbi:MAG: coproporphyrinogen III oxidase [Crocinitomicaceae bacterium]|nr:coproporphyrinogen III oxidase [Crocinitomicaceae bacterium]|tara:strand:+ start:37170 stop:38300 length:1131 start_codon:yes stop_codon:yes gene_type:complete